jgi:hypothetical protein
VLAPVEDVDERVLKNTHDILRTTSRSLKVSAQRSKNSSRQTVS